MERRFRGGIVFFFWCIIINCMGLYIIIREEDFTEAEINQMYDWDLDVDLQRSIQVALQIK